MEVTTIDQLSDVIFIGVMVVMFGLGFVAGSFR
jgi:hypothetical protein